MISMQGVPSVLIARNQSWVRKQAQSLVRHLPANVERADLIQVGLIAVAQAAVSFVWDGDRETPEAQEAFVRYARLRVKGAMLDELRQMDFLTRGERRKIKAVQIARERHRAEFGREASLASLATQTGLTADEIGQLMQADQLGRYQHTDGDDEGDGAHRNTPATPQEEVEARVDTAIVMRRLETFFAALPQRERLVIDAYLGVGLTPVELARSLKVSPSRISQIYHAVVRRVAVHFGHTPPQQRATDHAPQAAQAPIEALVRWRQEQLADSGMGDWGEVVEQALRPPTDSDAVPPALAPRTRQRPRRNATAHPPSHAE